MDLSWLKWPLVIAVVVGAFWLVSSAGVSFVFGRFSQGAPGADAAADARNEQGLTTLGNFLFKTLRYDKAQEVIGAAVERYPKGANVLLNQYRLVKLAEKQGNYERAVEILEYLIRIDAHSTDKRVPANEVLTVRAEKLKATHELSTAP